MSKLVNTVICFATEAHQRIDHRRKYSNQPYAVHLERVAKTVASVTDDEEMIAAAWLHDVVEDTPATLDDIERNFGSSIASLVRELTDVSKPGDGNRAVRKTIDREHLAQASDRAQTVKLADLIDNCTDITKHDATFSRVFLDEMKALLGVLIKGDEGLMRRAQKTMEQCNTRILKLKNDTSNIELGHADDLAFESHLKRQYNDIFTAKDLAEPLLSFDAETSVARVQKLRGEHRHPVATVRIDGEVKGYLALNNISGMTTCGSASRPFSSDQVLSGETGFAEVVHVLTRHEYCFVSLLGQIQGVIGREDTNKPYMRMWLFGIITLTEMRITEVIKKHFGLNEWQNLIPAARLEAAKAIQLAKARINQQSELIDCLQLADKGLLLINNTELLSRLGFNSKNAAKKVVKQFQSLRNNLAHAQDISTYDWAQIARISMRMLE